jgi:enoyl-CoA hydratase/carnithine racemase
MSTQAAARELVATVELSHGVTDAEIHARLQRLARRPGDAACSAVSGSFADGLQDVSAYGDWIGVASALPLPLLCLVDGPVGARGWAFIAAADISILSPDAAPASRLADAPGLTPLLRRRLGPQPLRRLMIGADANALESLVALGLCVRADDPPGRAADIAASLGTPDQARRMKRLMIAAEELPFGEALTFDLWFHRPAGETA